jgi:hypothetical protein
MSPLTTCAGTSPSGQATLEVGSPDGYRLPADEDDASLTHNVVKERDDPFGLGKAERQRRGVKCLLRLVHVR